MAKKKVKKAKKRVKRSYSGAQHTNLTFDWFAPSTSADSEVYSALKPLRDRARELVRNNDYAKGAIRTLTNNIVGTGVTLQSQVKFQRKDEFDSKTNAAIEELWTDWGCAEYCHTAGRLGFPDIERLIIKSLVESGEVFVRKVRQSFGGSVVPLALEVIESDQLNDQLSVGTYGNNTIKMGVELDQWARPVAYHFHPYHPGDLQFGHQGKATEVKRIPAEEIIHLYIADRPGQNRGVPWLHTALLRLRHMGGYEESEVVAARAQASVSGFIETPDAESFIDDVDEEGQAVKRLKPGVVETLAPGERFNGFAPTRPNSGFDAFIRAMLRGVAAGIGLSYESLSKDFSNTSYSSARTALLDERDNYRAIQGWLIRSFHTLVFREWLDLAVLSGALKLSGYELNPKFYCKPKWICRGWQWVDPYKEVLANKEAIKSGLDSLTAIAAQTGRDIEDILKERQKEQQLAKQLGIELDITMPSQEQPLITEASTVDGRLLANWKQRVKQFEARSLYR